MTDTPKPHITQDGYLIVPRLPPEPVIEKGVQCGQCGNRFDYGKAYGFVCPYSRCPVQVKAL